ncbi:MAG: DEAD/DEAH box helicase family protein [Porphyromonadaceae bacterium]|nr:DEAD/DEAH box helicase family protein [Porphyromonadaceae bacterium]
MSAVKLKNIYNTSDDDFVNDFFAKALSNSVTYDRGVGYFSSGWLKVNAQGMGKFAEQGGRARWVTSPILDKADWETMCLGAKAQQNELLYNILSSSISDLKNSLNENVLSTLAWLIADGIVDFRIAVPRNNLTGEFHDKFGIFKDKSGNKVMFLGSYNDSVHGLSNYESIAVFKTWEEHSLEIIESQCERFEKLWGDLDSNVKVFTLPESIKNEIVKLRLKSRPYKEPVSSIQVYEVQRGIGTPRYLVVREYQQEAIDVWFDNGMTGLLEMATGTGKTITALLIAVEYHKRKLKAPLIITCPYKHLVDQWDREARRFGFSPIKAYESSDSWVNKLTNQIHAYNSSFVDSLCVITTNTTFMSKTFKDVIKKMNSSIFLIADEAHHFGTNKSMSFLDDKFFPRLALSATPTRWFDDEGTLAVNNYFGGTVYSFNLQRAIKEGFLTNYYYYPVLVELTDDEILDYKEITEKIIPFLAKKNKTDSDDERLRTLLMKRSDILKNASNKLDSLRTILGKNKKIDHTLFYCSPRQREDLLKILGFENKIRVHQFTYQENNTIRQETLNRFDSGDLQAIVAIKCLDEGVDVPSTRTAFFLSNGSNPREFVQRRGRILRKAEGKQNSIIYDFITVPPESFSNMNYDLERSIVKKELTRFAEFANNSLNTDSAIDIIWQLAKKYNLMDL